MGIGLEHANLAGRDVAGTIRFLTAALPALRLPERNDDALLDVR